MNYVITGGAGNISKPLAEKLLADGHSVTVIGRNEQHLSSLVEKGAKAAIGSVEDPAFVTTTFSGADAVYTMVPPTYSASDWKSWIGSVGSIYADAIRKAGVRYVVNLSSVGAHLPAGAGPVSGLHRVEEALNKLEGVHILHLRPVYFFENLLANVPLVKNAGIIGSNFGGKDFNMLLTTPADIADVAYRHLSTLDFSGSGYEYIASDERKTDDIASVIGEAIGKPGLPWITFSDTEALNGMKQAGLPEEVAKNYVEMGNCIASGDMFDDYWKHQPQHLGKVKLEDFAKTFAAIYQAG